MSPHCLWPVIADVGGHLLLMSNILCCQNARKGAIPVPFPTRITGAEPSDGRWKAWALNKTKRERLSHKALENSQRSYGFMKNHWKCQLTQHKDLLSNVTGNHVSRFQLLKPLGAHALMKWSLTSCKRWTVVYHTSLSSTTHLVW